jgi:hypothetical protein
MHSEGIRSVEQLMSLLREISNLASDDCDVTTLLRKCKILASRLSSKEFAQWVGCELNGYPESEALPEYRLSNHPKPANGYQLKTGQR